MQLDLYITVPIVLGSILMVVNIIRYFLFIKNTHDVLSAGSVRDRVWKTVAGVMLVFFLFGYLFCAFVGEPDIVMALILFGGSVLFRHSAGEFRGRGGFQLLRRERLVENACVRHPWRGNRKVEPHCAVPHHGNPADAHLWGRPARRLRPRRLRQHGNLLKFNLI